MIFETTWFCNCVNVQDMTGTCGNYVLVTLLKERFENVYRRGATKLSIPGGNTSIHVSTRIWSQMWDVRYPISEISDISDIWYHTSDITHLGYPTSETWMDVLPPGKNSCSAPRRHIFYNLSFNKVTKTQLPQVPVMSRTFTQLQNHAVSKITKITDFHYHMVHFL